LRGDGGFLTTRLIQATQAAIAAAIIASIAAVLVLHATDKADDLFVVPWAAGTTFILTFVIWYLAFPSPWSGVWRALVVGALIVVLAIYVMWAAIALAKTGEIRHLVSASVPALFTLAVLGPVLFLVGALAALAIRFLQVRLQPVEADRTGAERRSRPARAGIFLKWLGRVFAVVVLIGVTGVLALGYLITYGDTVRFSSTSPSGRLTLHTREGCLGHACYHEGKLERHTGWFSSTSVPCRLGFSADFPFFGPGASARWNDDETIVSWTSSQGYKGQVDVRKDCGPRGE
jgi:hypothetical protein